MAEKKYVDVTIMLDKESYYALQGLMFGAMEEHPQDSAEHRVASHVRGAVDTATGHGRKFEP